MSIFSAWTSLNIPETVYGKSVMRDKMHFPLLNI